MKKAIIFTLSLLISQLALSQDTKPVPYKPIEGQKIVFDITVVDSSTTVNIQEHVLITKINEKTVGIEVISKVKAPSGKYEQLDKQVTTWKPIPDAFWKQMNGQIPYKKENLLVNNQIVSCRAFALKNQVIWFIVDDKGNHIFPGVAKMVADSKEILRLIKIENPTKKKK